MDITEQGMRRIQAIIEEEVYKEEIKSDKKLKEILDFINEKCLTENYDENEIEQLAKSIEIEKFLDESKVLE